MFIPEQIYSHHTADALSLQVAGRPPTVHPAGGAGGRQQSARKRPPVAQVAKPPHPHTQQEPDILLCSFSFAVF